MTMIDAIRYERGMRLIIMHPELPKAAIRMYIMLLLSPTIELRYRKPEIMEILGITDTGTARLSAEALVAAGLAVIPRNGCVLINNKPLDQIFIRK